MGVTVCTYNISVEYDTRNAILRHGPDTKSEVLRQKYQKIKPLYDEAIKSFEKNSNKSQWWENPVFHVTDKERDIFIRDRMDAQSTIFQTLFNKSDICLLQEIETQATLQSILYKLPKNRQIVYSKNSKFDTAIVWNTDRFENLTNLTIQCKERKSTTITLREKLTKKIIKVSSVHIPGFNLIKPSQDLKNDSLEGDQIVVDTLSKFDSTDCKPDCMIIGGDFNGEFEPAYLKDKDLDLTQRRFKLLKDKGFKHIDNALITSFNAHKKEAGLQNGQCTLDHLFVKNASNAFQLTNAELLFPPDDVESNPSDHRPLFFKVEL